MSKFMRGSGLKRRGKDKGNDFKFFGPGILMGEKNVRCLAYVNL